MYVFWKYTQSNADSRFLMHNNKKSIEIDFYFEMIRVLRVFLREKFFLKLRSFQAKKYRSNFEIIFLYSSGFQRLFSHFFHCSNQFFFGRNIDNSNRSKVNIYGNVLVTVFIFRTVMNFYPLNQCVYKSGC